MRGKQATALIARNQSISLYHHRLLRHWQQTIKYTQYRSDRRKVEM